MSRELINANITHVSYVDKGANQKKFFLTKADGPKTPTFQKEVKIITKADDEQQLVYGVVYEPDVPDAHDDSMKAEEIEKSAHKFLKDFRNIDTQHDFEDGAGELVESYIAPVDMDIDGEIITKGSWVIVTKATDEIWEAIKKGEYTGYSMAGTAETIEKQSTKKPVSKSNEDDEVKGFFNLVKNFFSGERIQKGAVKDKFDQRKKSNNFWVAIDSFESVLRRYNWQTDDYEFEGDESKIRDALQDLSDILIELLASENITKSIGKPPNFIEKAGKKISSARMDKINAAYDALSELKAEVEEEEEEVKKEDIEKAVQAALDPITKRLDELEKGNEPQSPEGGSHDDVTKQLEESIAKALEPLTNRLEAVEKARGISKQQIQETNPVQKSENGPSYLRLFD